MSAASRANIGALLANCAQFQTWMGADDATAALALIFNHRASTLEPPLCVLRDENDNDQRIGYSHFADSGSVMAVFDLEVPDQATPEAEFDVINAALDTLMGELKARIATYGPDVSNIRREGIMKHKEGESIPYWQVLLLFDWGAT